MTTLYLFDMHVPTIADSRLVDTVLTTDPTAEIRVDGLTPIKVADGIHVVNPADLTDLLTQKYLGLLAQYPGFTNIINDDLLDPSGIDLAEPSFSVLRKSGSRLTIGGTVQTTPVDVSPTIISQFIFVVETFKWRWVDSKTSRGERYYVQEPEANHTYEVSVDGGVNFTDAPSGSLVVSPFPGSSVVVRFNADDYAGGNGLTHYGSWAVIY